MDKGLLYEQEVRDSIATVEPQLNNFEMLPDEGGGYASNVVDLVLKIGNTKHGFEIKQNFDAQMGGSSVRLVNGTFEFAKSGQESIEPGTQEMIITELRNRAHHINDVFEAVMKIEPLHYHANTCTMSFRATKNAFNQIRDQGLLKPLNVSVDRDSSFIMDHYEKKKCFYIQVGDAGLFHMNDNPLDLPVPQLTGKIKIEIRLGRNGSAIIKSIGEKAAMSSLRAQARFKGKLKSPYSLDNPDHVHYLFSNL